jgi:hypothetical protein
MKNRCLLFLISAVSIFIASCTERRQPSNIIRTDFDDMKPWLSGSDAISEGMARSGRYALHVGPDKEFSMTWEHSLADLRTKGYSTAKASIWMNCPDSAGQIQWVASITSPAGINYEWKSVFISKYTVKDGRGWKKAVIEFSLPSNAPDAKLKIYGWSPNKEKAIIDDFELVFE